MLGFRRADANLPGHILQNHCVQVKQAVGQGNRGAVLGREWLLGAGQPVVGRVQVHPDRGAFPGKHQLPVIECAAASDGYLKTGMSAETEVHLPVVPVLHQAGFADSAAFQTVFHMELEPERIHRQGFPAAFQGKAGKFLPLGRHLEVGADAEAVDGHGVALAVQ